MKKKEQVKKEPLRLYDLTPNRGIKIYCECSDGSEYVVFSYLDGAYSYCTTEKGAVVHLSGGTPLIKFKDGYMLFTEKESKKEKTFKVGYTFNGSGYVITKAKNEGEAIDNFNEGIWDKDVDESQDYEVAEVEEIKS